ncbi:MAG: pseudouridine synthase [Crocinitomicaceae bacterium]|nr:pseudouridine synthase [Crocinitomicaceae bacterium]
MSDHHHYMLNKPYGYLSQLITNAHNDRKHKLLGELYDFVPGTMSIGRLDSHSEGLLLLTTNGKVSTAITSQHFEKEYYVQVDGIITDEAIEMMENGMELYIKKEHVKTLPARVKRIENPNLWERARRIRDDRHGPSSWISVTINQGMYRQVRRMTAAAGFPTLRLVRMRIGHHVLGDLKTGEAKEISDPSLQES